MEVYGSDRAAVDDVRDRCWVEAWLDEHPEFFQSYLIRKGTRSMVDSWLVGHALPPGPLHNMRDENEDDEVCDSSAIAAAAGGSGSETPVRKVSAHEFEKGGLTKPLINNIDGTPTFISLEVCPEVTGQIRKRSRNDVDGLNETDLIFELVKDICNDLDTRSLCHKILQNVGILTSADRCSLFLVKGEPGTENRCLVSNLFDVSSKSTVEEMSMKAEIKIPWGHGIVGYVAESGQPVNIEDCYQDPRFSNDVDAMTGYKTRSMMCHPIRDSSSREILGVAQVINKANGSSFAANDDEVFGKYLQFCGIGLKNAQLYERSQLEVRRNQVLLDLAGVIFQEQSTIDKVIHRILTHMLSLIRCERAMLLLVHETSKGTFSRVFQLDLSDLEQTDDPCASGNFKEGRFPINAGITGYVAATGETLNISDAHQNDRFDRAVDQGGADFKHKTILCMPIMHSGKPKKVLGLFQLINKFESLPFTKNDENFVEAFGIFCAMGISNVHLYEKVCVAMAKQQVTMEVLSYHATAPLEEALRLARHRIPSAAALQLRSLSFDDFGLENDETLKAAIRMFIDLDLLGRFHIDYNVLCRWLVSVKKNYRDVAYHNWRHAFNVAQMMFAILTTTEWRKKLGALECLSLLIACLCHDLDHRGTNNSFQVKSSSNLAHLYSTSTMEHHHFDQCLMILNTKGNQILANLSQDDFKRAITTIEDSILATDLAVYFKRRSETFSKMNSRSLDWSGQGNDRSLLRGLLMTACDLGAITKPWQIQRKVARLVAEEFFQQGDLERRELKLEPVDMMNRDKIYNLPSMQVNFIDTICSPIYDAFAAFSDGTLEPLLEGCINNKVQWCKLDEKHEDDPWDDNDGASKG